MTPPILYTVTPPILYTVTPPILYTMTPPTLCIIHTIYTMHFHFLATFFFFSLMKVPQGIQTTKKTPPKTIIEKSVNFIQTKYYQFELTFAVSMLEPWEKLLFSKTLEF